jgi:DNA helicase II / ATP-dependent DNA helicase PcrA
MNSLFSFFGDTATPVAPSEPKAPLPEPRQHAQAPRPVQFDPSAIRPAASKPADPGGAFRRGQKVRHEQFGEGTILTMEGNGPDAKLTVYFERAGSKKFVAKYVKLTKLN